jgi:hypothetical protein
MPALLTAIVSRPLAHNAIHDPLHLIGARDVGRYRHGINTLLAQLRDHRMRTLGDQIDHGNCCSGLTQGMRERTPDALSTTGHQCYPTVETQPLENGGRGHHTVCHFWVLFYGSTMQVATDYHERFLGYHSTPCLHPIANIHGFHAV